jgi:hypothetical protein
MIAAGTSKSLVLYAKSEDIMLEIVGIESHMMIQTGHKMRSRKMTRRTRERR